MKYKITENIYHNFIKYLEKEQIEAKEEYQNDIYFSPTHFPFLGGEIDNECLRLRVLEDKNILSYKKFIPATEEEPSHCIEHELEINDIEKLKLILNDLRIEEAFTLKKQRKYYVYKEQIEIALDMVDQLGYFVELEIIDTKDINHSLEKMHRLIEKFGITEDMRNYDGYSYLLFSKKKKGKE